MSHSLGFVKDAELLTRFHAGSTIHVYPESGETAQDRICLREEHWKQKGDTIGSGGFGSVWLEECIKGRRSLQWRAVKQVSKSSRVAGAKPENYERELEAIVKFSHRNYERCFVKSFGWYQNEDSVFITMEYLKHGNLQEYLQQNPALREPDAQQICFQILDGLKFMHENNISHRDVKPANILIKSKPPDGWWVKLGDFGISKHAGDNNATQTTKVQGTLPYMAPELLGFIRLDKVALLVYSSAADIWAVGETVFQMLTKSPVFHNFGGLSTYTSQPETFPSAFLQFRNFSTSAINFIARLMTPKPQKRPTALNAMLHAWLEDIYTTQVVSLTTILPEKDGAGDENLLAPHPSSQQSKHSTSGHSAKWTTVSMPTSPLSGTIRISEPSKPKIDTIIAPAPTRPRAPSNSTATIKATNFTKGSRFFVIKSYNSDNIESSLARGVWSSNRNNNTMLSNAYVNSQGEVYLMFSVNGSRQFCGVAKMKSQWSATMTNPHWKGGIWDGGFSVEWLSNTAINFDEVSHLKHKEDGIPITRARFVLEICSRAGEQMMQRFGVPISVGTPLLQKQPLDVVQLPRPPPRPPPPIRIASPSTEEPPAKSRLELEVLFLRARLQQGLLSTKEPPKAAEMPLISEYMTRLEQVANNPKLRATIIRSTSIHRVMKRVSKMNSIPRNAEFHLTKRSLKLLNKWNSLLNSAQDEPKIKTSGQNASKVLISDSKHNLLPPKKSETEKQASILGKRSRDQQDVGRDTPPKTVKGRSEQIKRDAALLKARQSKGLL